MIPNDVLAILVKATLILGAGLSAGALVRRGSAGARHRLWSATLGAALALPFLALLTPRLRVAIPGWRTPEASVAAHQSARAEGQRSSVASEITAPASRSEVADRAVRAPAAAAPELHVPSLPRPSALVLVGLCWLVGAGFVLARLAAALRRVARLAAGSRELTGAAWDAASRRLSTSLGLRARVRIVASPGIATPMAGGLARPTIFLPEAAASWPDDVRDVVLAHEMAHLARRDPLRHVISRVALAVYWFHPLAWLVAKRAVTTCEQACDDAVLALGVRPSTYAGVLLDFAAVVTDAPAFAAALPIVRPSQLEDRLMAILNFSREASGRHRATLTVVIAAVATPLIAAVQPARVGPANIAPATGPARGQMVRTTSLAPRDRESIALDTVDAAPPRQTSRRRAVTPDDACDWDGSGMNFSGTIEMNDRNGVQRRVGTTDNSRVIQTSFGDLRVCAVGDGVGRDTAEVPSAWPAHASRVLLETRMSGDVRRMEIAGGKTTWTVNDQSRPVDASALAWRDRLLALLDPTWQLSELHGRVSSLRGEISSVEGQRSSLEGEISSLRGEVSSMEGEISSVRGQVSSMEGEISSVRGHVSSLRGEISSERGAMSSLDASGGSDADYRRHEDNIRKIEAEITAYDAEGRVAQIESRIAAFNADSQVAATNQRLKTFDVDGQVAAVQQRIRALDVDGQTKRIQDEIDALHEDTRATDLQSRIDAAEKQLRDVLGGH